MSEVECIFKDPNGPTGVTESGTHWHTAEWLEGDESMYLIEVELPEWGRSSYVREKTRDQDRFRQLVGQFIVLDGLRDFLKSGAQFV